MEAEKTAQLIQHPSNAFAATETSYEVSTWGELENVLTWDSGTTPITITVTADLNCGHEKDSDGHQTVEIIKLNGSIELAPIVGLSDVICDIVETGATLRENGFDVLEEVCPLSARMIVNEVSMKMENERIIKLIRDLKEVL